MYKEHVIKNYFSYFSTKTYIVGTQINYLNEAVLLSTPKNVRNDGQENIHSFSLTAQLAHLNI